MFCTTCGTRFEDGDANCVECGAPITRPGQSNAPQGDGITVKLPPMPSSGQFMGFLAFEKMITPSIMKGLYVIGSIIIIFASLFTMFSGGAAMFFSGVLFLVLGLVFFRVFCEQMLLFFTMNKRLGEIRDSLRR